MKMLTYQDYQRVRKWVYRYARYLDITRWQYHFEHGSKQDVLEALLFYQNADGGFGHALECDCWNPNSTPVSTFMAWNILKEIGYDKKDNPVIKSMLKYLEQGDFWNEKGCLWSIPSNNQYPVQPWYLYPNAPWFPKDWPPQNYTNGDFVQFVMKYAKKESKLYKGALQIIEYRLSIMDTLAEFLSFVKSDIEQGIEIHDWIKLIKCLQENKLKSEEECEELFTKLDAIIKKNAMDGVYQSSKKLIEQNDLGEEELDAMVEQIANGIWSEEGLKCENPEQRLKEIGSVGELWWPIYGLIDSIRILREHNRLE
ncbi:hypothetical protein [Candidatus Galacturonibacter soehngenii]|uniref:Squalene cyclase C-terminal domain-containing protein n=1 Tax=Candidatus Galacturonatibacter soehngenii TaxID=2307010 RepID=A0A7V7QMX1_9FIRM|nr:hypothetical protein [Candidatus Galacturonibacter soehngenii]KAB1439683.1 hypothetical protein F7O84_04655 [Candidatus Galacturonibacter soehngenii]